MSELCHICDLFRTALFGPTNTNEDHLDDGLGNDLPRPMADAPATMGVRSRTRSGVINKSRAADAVAVPGGSGATATPSVASEVAGPRYSTEGATAGSGAAAARASAEDGLDESGASATAPTASGRQPLKTKFSQRGPRGLKAAPAYMSFDDVDIEDDDSDGELFVENSRSPATMAHSANAPSVYRQPDLPAPTPSVPSAPGDVAPMPPPPAYDSRANSPGPLAGAIEAANAYKEEEGGVPAAAPQGGLDPAVYMSREAVAGGVGGVSSVEGFPVDLNGLRSGAGNGVGGDRMAIPRDGSMSDSARPHAQSESFHGYRGYPGYEPDTPVATQEPYAESSYTDSLTIHPGADVRDPRIVKVGSAAAPTPSSVSKVRLEPPIMMEPTGTVSKGGYIEDLQHDPNMPFTNTMDADIVGKGEEGKENQHVIQVRMNARQLHQQQQHVNPGTGLPYGAVGGAYGTSGTAAATAQAAELAYRPSPSHSVANSIASSFRRDDSRHIHQDLSEDGIGSMIGTLVGTEDSANEDLQWKRSALKKFHKVMVKGEGLRVVKHNRSGGSQMRIIRYDPDIKALVWNSKRYMKKAGSANIPIVDIKRVGREGNTVSVTAAGRGTIGFEPQRIRDAKILAEALRALVDKEERSAMWRG